MSDVELGDPLVFGSRSLSDRVGDVEDLVAGLEEGAVWADFFDDAGTVEADDMKGMLGVLVVV